jgi:hypothetical protein
MSFTDHLFGMSKQTVATMEQSKTDSDKTPTEQTEDQLKKLRAIAKSQVTCQLNQLEKLLTDEENRTEDVARTMLAKAED